MARKQSKGEKTGRVKKGDGGGVGAGRNGEKEGSSFFLRSQRPRALSPGFARFIPAGYQRSVAEERAWLASLELERCNHTAT